MVLFNLMLGFMRELFLKYFPRLLAVLGCSTLVTACYGVPYDSFEAKVSGEVLDADSGMPIKGISVRVTPGVLYSGSISGGLKGLRPFADGSTVDARTDVNGAFSVYVGSSMGVPDAVLIECVDIDGEVNGSYLSGSEIVPIKDEESVSEVICLEKNDL